MVSGNQQRYVIGTIGIDLVPLNDFDEPLNSCDLRTSDLPQWESSSFIPDVFQGCSSLSPSVRYIHVSPSHGNITMV